MSNIGSSVNSSANNRRFGDKVGVIVWHGSARQKETCKESIYIYYFYMLSIVHTSCGDASRVCIFRCLHPIFIFQPPGIFISYCNGLPVSWIVNLILQQEDKFQNNEAFLDKLCIVRCLKRMCLSLHISLAIRTTHWIRSREQPTRGDPPALGLGWKVTSHHGKNETCCMLHVTQCFGSSRLLWNDLRNRKLTLTERGVMYVI